MTDVVTVRTTGNR